jgi:hypothetical protein
MSLLLTLVVTASGQDRRRAPRQVGNPVGLGGTVTAGVKNRKPMNLGDTGTHEVGHVKGKSGSARTKPQLNLGDTGTHEVGHVKGNRRPTPKGWGFGASNPTVVNNQSTGKNSQNNRVRTPQPKSLKLGDIKGEVINSQQPNAAKYDGIDGESNDARTKSPNSGASPAGIAGATEVAAKDIRKQSNQRRKPQNLLPYMEQSNLKARPRAKQFGAGNQVEAKTKGN